MSFLAPAVPYISAATSVMAASQASALGKYNQSIMNRNALVKEQEAEAIKTVLLHPLYTFINNICRYGNFNNIRILQRFPYCANYDDVYKHFNITPEEITFIENNIK